MVAVMTDREVCVIMKKKPWCGLNLNIITIHYGQKHKNSYR